MEEQQSSMGIIPHAPMGVDVLRIRIIANFEIWVVGLLGQVPADLLICGAAGPSRASIARFGV